MDSRPSDNGSSSSLEGDSLSSNRDSTARAKAGQNSTSEAEVGRSILGKLSLRKLAVSAEVVVSTKSSEVVRSTATRGESFPSATSIDFNEVSSDAIRARSLLPGDSGRAASRGSSDNRSSRSRSGRVDSRFRPDTSLASDSTDLERDGGSAALKTGVLDGVEREAVRVIVSSEAVG